MSSLRRRAAIAAILALPFLHAQPAAAAPAGAGFTVTAADLAYILQQIKIAEAHVAGTTSATGPCGALAAQIGSPVLSLGLRTVDGSCNNLTAAGAGFGAADRTFPRLGDRTLRPAETAPAGMFGPGSPSFPTTYADARPGNTVVDSQPRMISNLIADQTAANPAAVAAAGFPVRTQGSPGVEPCSDTRTTDCVPAGRTLFIPNVSTDIGLSTPYNSWFTLFGQFFDHGIDQTVKGGGTVVVPLRADDPLIAGTDRIPGTADDPKPGDARYVAPSMRFMTLTRAAGQPDAVNTDTPFVDNSQTYTSHASHQVFLRSYDEHARSDGRLLGNAAGGLPTWADVKNQARAVLGLLLTDADVLDVPQLLTDPYGRFVPGPARGLPQYVTRTGLVEGDTAHPVPVPAGTLHFDTPFLTDIAHAADPTPKDTDHNPATPPVTPPYDRALLDAHYLAGDGRVNENIGLTSIHVIFHGEHNRLVDDIERVLTDAGTDAEWRTGDDWNGERIFQAARFVSEMEYQHLVFEEFARKISPAINPFAGAYSRTELDPAISAEFAHAVYRFGHSMLTETIARTAPDGTDDSMSLLDGFLNPAAYTDGGRLSPEQAAGEIVTGMAAQAGNELDEFMTDTLRDNLLGLPMDLAAINLARGRSEGVPPLNALRRRLGLAPYRSWVDLGEHLRHPESLVNFVAAYGRHPDLQAAATVAAKRAAAQHLVDTDAGFMNGSAGLDDVDLWIGGLAEETNPFGGLLGSTFTKVFEDQLTALQDGDRLYYLSRTPGMNLRTQLESNSFAELIMRNTTARSLKADVFATADCTFQLSALDGTAAGYTRSGNRVADDPATACDENALLIRLPDGTIKYRARNSVDKPGLNGQSVFEGTEEADRIEGGNDNDTVWGDEGDDRIEGGAGDDIALGGEGDDLITDAAGDDFPRGGPGNDVIDSGPGLDIVAGGDGSDFVASGANTDETFGGPGDDLVAAGDGDDTVSGDSGDDWAEGGAGDDTLQGDSGNPFTLDDANTPGHDVLIGQGGDDELALEGGDDVAVQGPGSERTLGGSGFDWAVAGSPGQGGGDEPMTADLSRPIEPVGAVRDRYKEVEALSGGEHDDTLTGDDLVPTASGSAGGGLLGCDALDAAGVARIAGLDQVVTTRSTSVPVVGNATGRPCDLHGLVWGAGNILLGGPGDDTITGRGGDDIIDGDRSLSVRLSVRDAGGHEVRSARTLAELQPALLAGEINPGTVTVVREIRTAATPGTDTAVFAGTRAEYTIHTTAAATTVVGPDGTDTLRNIERLRFDDTTVDLTPPAAPTAVTAVAGDARATVTWTAPADVDGLPVTGFQVERTGGALTDATTPGITVTGLTNGTAYTFRVRAVNEAGPGAWSESSAAVTPAAPVVPAAVRPGRPGEVTATEGDAAATVSWTVPTATGSAPVTGFQVQALDLVTLEQAGALRTAGPAATTLVVPGLTNGTPYWFRVRAISAAGVGAWSDGSNPVTPVAAPVVTPPVVTPPVVIPPVVTPPVVTPPAAPGSLTVARGAKGGPVTATLRWTAPSVTGGPAVTGYRITRQRLTARGTATGKATVVTVPAGDRSAVFTAPGGVPAGTGYRFTVQATGTAGHGPGRTVTGTVR